MRHLERSPKALLGILTAIRTGYAYERRVQKAGVWEDQGLVFPSTVVTPISHRNLVRSFKALLKRAGLPIGTRLHDLRHTCATLLHNDNVHPKYVQERLLGACFP